MLQPVLRHSFQPCLSAVLLGDALLHLLQVIWEQNPSILDIYADLKVTEKAQKVDIGAVEGKIMALKQGN